MSEFERQKFFEMMRQVHADKALRTQIVADVRKLAADPVWCAERAAELTRDRIANLHARNGRNAA